MEACLMLNTDHLYESPSSFLCLRHFCDVSKGISHHFWLISDFRRLQGDTHARHLAGRHPLLGEDSTTPTGVQEWDSSCKGKANFSTLQRKQGLLQSNLMGPGWHRDYRAGNTHIWPSKYFPYWSWSKCLWAKTLSPICPDQLLGPIIKFLWKVFCL